MQEETKEKLIFLGVCFLLVFSIYGRTIAGDFVFDDRGIVEHQYLLGNLNNLHRILALPYWAKEAGLYRPITLASYTFNFVFFGSGAWGFHFINLIIYSLTGFLFFLFLEKFFKSKFLAYLVALSFFVLPIHTEAVANIIGRAELLALFFSLLALNELVKEKRKAWKIGLWFLLALGSKETAIATFPLAFLLVTIKEKKILLGFEAVKRWFRPLAAFFFSAIIYFAARFLVLGWQYFLSAETTIVENPLKFAPAAARIATAFKIVTLYFKKTFWPIGLCSDYSYNQIPVSGSLFNLETLIGLAIILFFAVSIFVFWKRFSFLALGSAIFLFSFLPVSNLFFSIGTIAGERLIYFPSLGVVFYIAAFFAWLCYLMKKKIYKIAVLALFFVLIIFYGAMSFLRAGDWMSEKKLFTSAAKCASQSVLSRSNLGAVFYLEGNLAEAKKELLLAQSIYGGYPKGVNNLGLIYWKEGDKQKASELFLKALSFKFPYYGAYENLALMALENGNIVEAKEWLTKFYSGNSEAAEIYIKVYQSSI